MTPHLRVGRHPLTFQLVRKSPGRSQLRTLTGHADELTRLRIRGLLTDEEFQRQRQELERERLRLQQQRDQQEQRGSWFEPARRLISLSHSVVSRFEQGGNATKRLIVETVGSNPVLIDGELRIDARKPFRGWTKPLTLSDKRGLLEDVRTLVTMTDPKSVKLVEKLKEILADDPDEDCALAA